MDLTALCAAGYPPRLNDSNVSLWECICHLLEILNVSEGSGGDCDPVKKITKLNGRYGDWLFETGRITDSSYYSHSVLFQ